MVKWGPWRGGGSWDLEWGPQVGPESPAAALGVDPLPAPPEDYVDLDVDQQGDDEGHVEGDDRGVDHKGRVGDDALALFWRRESTRRVGQQAQGPERGPSTQGAGHRCRDYTRLLRWPGRARCKQMHSLCQSIKHTTVNKKLSCDRLLPSFSINISLLHRH